MNCLAARGRQVCVAEAEHPDGSKTGLRISHLRRCAVWVREGGMFPSSTRFSWPLVRVALCFYVFVFLFFCERLARGPSGSRLLRLSQLTARSLPISNDLEPYCRATVGNDTQQTIAQGSGTVAPSWSQRLTFKGASPLPGASVCIGTRTIMTEGRAKRL